MTEPKKIKNLDGIIRCGECCGNCKFWIPRDDKFYGNCANYEFVSIPKRVFTEITDVCDDYSWKEY